VTALAMTAARADVQSLVPDAPEWVEARAMALDDDAWALRSGAGFVLGADGARLLVAVGAAAARDAIAALAARGGWTLLAAIDRSDVVAAGRAVGRTVARAVIHTLAEPDDLPDLPGAELLGRDDELGHLAPALADELGGALARAHQVWCARVDGKPVSFAYAPWRSERWFDVSVDTAPGFRQLGLATIVAAAMIRGEHDHGRKAVWGADEDNGPSLRLARRLGFEKVAELWVIA
jgi:predicted GNAT family acetyltransferase